MDKHITYKIKLFVLKVLGDTTSRENEELEALLEKKKSYRSLLTDLTNPKEYNSRQKQLQLIDTEQELEHFLSGHRTPTRKIRHFYWRAAAIVIPLLTGSVIAWQMFPKAPVSYQQAQSKIAPGASGAILVLSNGTKQLLSPETQLFTETNGTQIHTDSNQLNYTTNNTIPQDTTPIYNHLLVDRGFEYMLVLQDGTKVWMNSESELHYPVQFASANRKVRLKGEAYFEVARDSIHPFIVEVNDNFEVKVLGTHFNIKAYPSDDQFETTLLEGKVAISAPSLEGSTILAPSQQMVIRKNGEHLVRKVNPDYAIAWHNGWFYFDNETLEKTLELVGRWYNIDFTFEDLECKYIRVSGKVKRFENLQVILDMLKTTTKCNYILDHEKIYVTKNNRK